MKKLVLFTCFLALVTASAFSQGGRFWTPNNQDAAAIVKHKAVSRVFSDLILILLGYVD